MSIVLPDPHQNQNDRSSGSRPTAGHYAYLPWELVHFSLPYRTPAETSWVRKNGDRCITISAGPVQRPDGTTESVVPSGKYARAALLFLCTQAKLTNSPVVLIGTSYRMFMRDLGISWSASSAREAARQLQALAACTITVSTQSEDGLLVDDTRFTFSSSSRIQFGDRSGTLAELGESRIILNDELFGSVLERGNPINRQAWQQLSSATKSPLALDVYCWLSARLYTTNRLTHITWPQLFEQFGSTGSSDKFRQNFLRALQQVKVVYPEANVTVVSADNGTRFRGIFLQPSPSALDSYLGPSG